MSAKSCGLVPQRSGQGLHEPPRQGDPLLEDRHALVRTGVDDVRFRAQEHRGDHHLGPGHKNVERHVVPEELPAPRGRLGRFTVQGEVVAVLVHELRQLHELTEEPVDPHQVPHELEP